MRNLYPLVACIGLSVVPSIGRAAPTAERTSQSVSPLPAAATAPQSPRADGLAAENASDMARYAQREAQSPAALEYRGGNTVVIGTTAAIVILAIVLVIVLL